jgi:arginine/serine-rich splicing factor 4/5/6
LALTRPPRSRTRERDLEKIFDYYGRIEHISMKQGFAFVDFRDERGAEKAVRDMDGRHIDDRRVQVQFARGPRDDRPAGPRGGKGKYKLRVEGLGSRTSWQDLKDFARRAGRSVVFTDVWSEGEQRVGVIEFDDREDYANALRMLPSEQIDGHGVRIVDMTDAAAAAGGAGASGGSAPGAGSGAPADAPAAAAAAAPSHSGDGERRRSRSPGADYQRRSRSRSRSPRGGDDKADSAPPADGR